MIASRWAKIYSYISCPICHIMYLVCGSIVVPLLSILCCSYRPPTLKFSSLGRWIRGPPWQKGDNSYCIFQGLSLDCKFHKTGTVPFISVSRMHSVWHTVSDVSIINTVVLLMCVQIITFLVLFFESPSYR